MQLCKLDTCTEPSDKAHGGFCCEQHRRQAQREQARAAQAFTPRASMNRRAPNANTHKDGER